MSNIEAKGKASAQAYSEFALGEYATDEERFTAQEDYFAGFVGGAKYYASHLEQLKTALQDLVAIAEKKKEHNSLAYIKYLLQRFK